MGRRIPLADDSLIKPIVSLSLFAAAMVAVIALIGGLCGFRRKSQRADGETQTESSPPEATAGESNDVQSKEAVNPESNESEENKSDLNPELPLPPARKVLRETYSCNNMEMKSKSTRKLNSSLTAKIPRRTMSMRKNRDDEGDNKLLKKKKLKTEDSILGRPIILGEKCRVPHDDEEDEDFGLKRQRIRAYHPRSTSSVTLSRMNSKIDMNAIPWKDVSKDLTRKEEKRPEEDEDDDEQEEQEKEKEKDC